MSGRKNNHQQVDLLFWCPTPTSLTGHIYIYIYISYMYLYIYIYNFPDKITNSEFGISNYLLPNYRSQITVFFDVPGISEVIRFVTTVPRVTHSVLHQCMVK